jgi:hypothetical protein
MGSFQKFEQPSIIQYSGAKPVPVPIKHLETGVPLSTKCPSGNIPEKVVPIGASQMRGLHLPSGILLIMRVKF